MRKTHISARLCFARFHCQTPLRHGALLAALILIFLAPSAGAQSIPMKDKRGKVIAHMVVTDSVAIFDSQQRLTRGAGYLQADGDNLIHLVANIQDSKTGASALTEVTTKIKGKGKIGTLFRKAPITQLQLRVSRIEWDENGATTLLDGLIPVLGRDDNTTVRMVAVPTLQNGLLTLHLTDGEYVRLRTRFWYQTDIEGGNASFLPHATVARPVPVKRSGSQWKAELARPQLVAYLSQRASPPGFDLSVVGIDGQNQRRLSDGKQDVRSPRWSPDGKRIAFLVLNGDPACELWKVNADGTGLAKLADCGGSSAPPAWSPDSLNILYTVNSASKEEMHIRSADGTDRGLPASTGRIGRAWSPDGQWLAFEGGGGRTVGFMRPDGSAQHLIPTSGISHSPVFSADSRQILFVSSASARPGLFLFDLTSFTVRRLTPPAETDLSPTVAPAGSQIAFLSDRLGRTELFASRSDGFDQHPILKKSSPGEGIAFSPDGNFVAFPSKLGAVFQICIVRTDGRDLHQITKDSAQKADPQWQPAPPSAASPATH
jgi:Tol biopolymer transport system component